MLYFLRCPYENLNVATAGYWFKGTVYLCPVMQANTRIGLLGYGKMGKAIDALAEQHGCTVAWRVGREGATLQQLQSVEAVIEFSNPHSGFENVMQCLRGGVPVVSGTTGWQAQLPEARAFALENDGALLWASNFSVGVNLFFALNRHLARLMQPHAQYAASITETHHIHKLDAPSGTAVTIGEGILETADRYEAWTMDTPTPMDQIPIVALREGEVPGTHTVHWQSAIDSIEITHTAHNRTGFAAGALLAARWLAGRKGVFSMADVLGI
jgi:4-hydroxy-tetrahydrodipicolinate reductase